MIPPPENKNVIEWEQLCLEVLLKSLELIEGREDLVDVARKLSALAHKISMTDDDDFLTFIAIDSETDTLPIGEVRRLWSKKALEREDMEIARAVSLYQIPAQEAAKRLVLRFGWAVEAREKRLQLGHYE